MSRIRSTFSQGRVFTGEKDCYLGPLDYAGDGSLPGVIWCHGRGNTAASVVQDTNTGEMAIIRAIANVFPVVVADLGGTATWGSPTAVSRIAAAKTALQTTFGAKTGKVMLVGMSMGHANAFDYWQQNPTAASALVGICGVSDMSAMYTSNRSGFQAEIATALGVTAPAAIPASADPNQTYSALVGKPIKYWYGGSDSIVLPAEVTALAAKVGATAVNVGAFEHAGPTMIQMNPLDVLAFLQANRP